MNKLLLTVQEAAAALGISRSKLYELLSVGAIRSVRIDSSRRIPAQALAEFVARLALQDVDDGMVTSIAGASTTSSNNVVDHRRGSSASRYRL